MHKLHLKSALSQVALIGLASVLSSATFAQTASSCKALVQIRNNLWLVKADGSVIGQVTNDSQFRSAAALSPSGNLIAFSGKDSPSDVSLVDTSGRLITDVDVQATDAITELKWINSALLRAEEHSAPDAGRFHFIQFGPGNTASVLQTAPAEGSTCATSPNGKDMVCAIGAAAVELNGRTIYQATDAFASATTVQAIDIAVGTAAMTSTSPPFRVDVIGIDGTTVQMRITTADGFWTEQYVPAGNAMDVQFSDAADTASQYAVLPATNTNSGVVHLSILRSGIGQYSFEGGIAWDPRGERIAVVEANANGQRSWVLLNRQMGQAATTGNGAVDAKEVLPIDGPVRSVAFTSDTHLRIEGANQVFDKDIPAEGKIAAGGPYLISPGLPQQLTVSLGTGSSVAEVRGWSCP
jgi:hypothetical protein